MSRGWHRRGYPLPLFCISTLYFWREAWFQPQKTSRSISPSPSGSGLRDLSSLACMYVEKFSHRIIYLYSPRTACIIIQASISNQGAKRKLSPRLQREGFPATKPLIKRHATLCCAVKSSLTACRKVFTASRPIRMRGAEARTETTCVCV